MYAPWDWDLYLINNCFWDTRIEKLYNMYCFYHVNKIKNMERIYFDIIHNMSISTIKYYTYEKWDMLDIMTEAYSELYQNELKANSLKTTQFNQHGSIKIYPYDNFNNSKFINRCDDVCNIVELVLKYNENDLFVNKNSEQYFWIFIMRLCHNSNFNRWFKIHYFSWCCSDFDSNTLDKKSYEDFILLIYENIIKQDNSNVKIRALVTLLYYSYSQYVKIKNNNFFLDEFPEKTVNIIKEITNVYPDFVGNQLVELVKIAKNKIYLIFRQIN